MKLYNTRLEMTAIRTLCESKNKKDQGKLLARLSASHFYNDSTTEAFNRLLKVLNKTSELLDWSHLIVDPLLSDEAKDELNEWSDIVPYNKTSKIKHMFEQLDYYRKARTIYFEIDRIGHALEKEHVDIDRIIEQMASKLVDAQLGSGVDHEIITLGGKNSNSDKLVESILANKKQEVIPTGFWAFDERNGGILPGSLFVIAATTGGGKSTLISQMAKNFATSGHRCNIVPLEMTKKECLARIMANVSGIDVRKFLYLKLTEREVKKFRQKWEKFNNEVNRLGGKFRIFEPEEDLSIEEILTVLKPYNDDVIMIDYIGLLKGTDGDDNWRTLGRVARYAKVWAKSNNKIVVLAAQLSDEGAIRYSRAIKEHSNLMWTWTYGDENRETGIIDIVQQKARNQEAFDFQLGHNFSTMRMYDLDDNSEPAQERRRSKKGRIRHKKLKEATDDLDDLDKYLGDISD